LNPCLQKIEKRFLCTSEFAGPGAVIRVSTILIDTRQKELPLTLGVLSLQLHHHRAEHWIVVNGTAKVTKGEDVFILSENESTYIPLGTKHRLENIGKIPLELIEVQTGSYLGEDDIVRFDDVYGREDKE
jgi:mannose-6-phosphate isomerase-like protein (cupin superfamily)